MKNFWQHIESLLVENDYVVIPGFGGYVVQLQSSTILKDCITPPLHTIGFNALMKHNDGLLAVEIAKSNHITFREAMRVIKNEIDIIHYKLSVAGSVEAGNLGKLEKSYTGDILFTPNKFAELLPDNYGLSVIQTSSIQKISEKRQSSSTIYHFTTSHFYRYAAAIIVFLGLFFSTPDLNKDFTTDYASLATVSFIKNPELIMSSSVTDSIPTDTVQTVEHISTIKRFHIIVSSWKSLKTACVFRSEISEEYTKAEVLSSLKTHYVAVESFENRDSAISHMEELRTKDHRFRTAWVLCK